MTANPDFPLPRSVKPTAYDVTLHPRITDAQYNGSVEIDITCQEPTRVITLHAHEQININDVKIKNIENNIEITNISRNSTNETIFISVEQELEVGVSYKLYFVFNGPLQPDDKFYRPDSDHHIGGLISSNIRTPVSTEERWYVRIAMVPKTLRRVFPCFDEPSFKATFKISITHGNNMSATSVMPIESSELVEDDLVSDHFLATPPLSTSSISVLVFDFETNTTMNANTISGDVSVNFFNRQEAHLIKSPHSTIHTTVKILEYLEDYFKVPYPLSKLDIVGVPNLYYQTASSSLGLVTTLEYFLNEGSDATGHELCNQWFKHIITPEKWELFNITDILCDYMLINIRNKGIKMSPYYMQKGDLYNMFASSFKSQVFWDSYDKLRGTWFLEMLNSSLTEKTMQTALGNLIKNNIYSTYSLDILWEEISKQAYADGTLSETISVQNIVQSWLKNQRFPVLTVTRNYDENTAQLQQHMFYHNSSHKLTEAEQEVIWSIPIIYISKTEDTTNMVLPVIWMTEKKMVISSLPDADSFIIVNPTDS
ncbi:hypothetical protein L9F63_001991, partial [Diploptera punctata]